MALNEVQKRALISAFRDDLSAQIFESDVLSPFTFQVITLNLSTARSISTPYNIAFPFKAIALKNATGGSGTVYARFNTQDSGISWLQLDNNDSVNSERMFGGVDLYWSAQSGKTMDVLLFTNAKFESGSLINSGTISVSSATGITTTRPTLGASTAGVLVAANSSAKKRSIQNRSLESIFIAESNTVTASGANCGFEIQSYESVELQNTSVIYGYSVGAQAAGNIIVVEES